MTVTLRPARDDDGLALIDIIGRCFALYPGCVLDVEDEMPELIDGVATAFARTDGALWVAADPADDAVLGCCGWTPDAENPGAIELKKLYVDPDLQGRGLGRRLVEHILADAAARGSACVLLWTDTRFTTAHRLYEKMGFVRAPQTRRLHDLSATVEYRYRWDRP